MATVVDDDIDPEDAEQVEYHELCGRRLKGVVPAIPYTVGSSVGAYVISNLSRKSLGPSALVAANGDITLVPGCAPAGLPLADGFELTDKRRYEGRTVTLDGDSGELTVG